MSVDKWEQRMLCPDGACVGVISMNGTCKTCGKAVPDWGDPRKPGRVSSKAEADELEAEHEETDDEDAADEPAAEAEPGDEADDDVTKRKLCTDGACIGVIGTNGKCKVCGKAADGSPSSDDDDEYDEDDDDEADDGAASGGDEEAGDGDTVAAEPKSTGNGAVKTAAKTATKADDENRALCVDGACIGVIGDNGKCKVCGKAAA